MGHNLQLIRVGIWPAVGRPRWVLAPGPSFHIGRSQDCEVALDDPAVSAYHAQVCDNGWQVRDLSSTNGLFLEGVRVAQADYSPEKSLRVGGYTLRWDQVDPRVAPRAEMEFLVDRLERAGDHRLGEVARAWAEAAPADPAAQLAAARWCIQSGRLQQADAAVKRALLAGGENWRGLFLAARVAEEKGDLEDARDLLRRVEAARPGRPDTERAMLRVEQKREVYAKVRQLVAADAGPAGGEAEALLTAGPFRISFVPAVHGELVLTTHSALAAAAERLEGVLGFTPSQVRVRLSAGAGGGWRAAAYDGEIEVFVPRGQRPDPNFFLVALTHEYVHLAVDRLTRGSAPAWLTEGLAQYITQNQTPSDREILEKALAAGATLPLEALTGNFEALEEKPLVDLAYAQAYSLVSFLAARNGLAGLSEVLAALGENQGLAAAMARLDLEPETLEEQWLAWLA